MGTGKALFPSYGLYYRSVTHQSMGIFISGSLLNSAIALELAFWLAEFVRRRLIKINCLTLEVEPVGDNRVNRRPDLAVIKPEHLEIGTFASAQPLRREIPVTRESRSQESGGQWLLPPGFCLPPQPVLPGLNHMPRRLKVLVPNISTPSPKSKI
ncbi:MAG: hypothetical protein AAFY20_16920 [Cyanobacteria bacterium J06639_14]